MLQSQRKQTFSDGKFMHAEIIHYRHFSPIAKPLYNIFMAKPDIKHPEKPVEEPQPKKDSAGRIQRPGRPLDQTGILRWVPGLYVLRNYQRSWLIHDFFAGLVLTAILVPVGMAYAQAAGLPAILGLYATIIPLLAYALFGPSRIMVLGPDSSLAPMIAAAVLPLTNGDVQQAILMGAALAILSGLFGVLAGFLHLGFVTDLLSKPIRYGYMNGIALTVLISQLPKLFGFSAEGKAMLDRLYDFIGRLVNGETNWAALVIGGTVLALILWLRRWPRLPGLLIAVGSATFVVDVLGLAEKSSLSVIGELPKGLPAFTIPWISMESLISLVPAALAIAAVVFADASVLSRVYAAKTKSYVDPNQEMIGLGVANIMTGLFQGFPVSVSTSRTPVAESSGSKTQLTGVVGALVIVLLLVFAPGLLRNLPTTALAAVVIASAVRLFQVNDLPRLYRIQRWEFWLSMAAFAGVALVGPVPGMLIAIGIALAEFIWDGWRPHYAVLGRVDGIKGYHDIKRYPHARLIPGLVIFRWDAPLFFANAEHFHNAVLDAISESPTPVKWLVVMAEPVTSIDVTSVDMLIDLDSALMQADIQLVFAEMKDPVKDKLKRFQVFKQLGEDLFFHTAGQAVKGYLRAHPDVIWEDWEDRHE